MMKVIIYAAAVLLVLQIGLTVAVHQQQAVNLESTAPDAPFLSFAPDSISSITIKGPEQAELILEKSDKGWIMPKAFSAPASSNQVDGLLQKLADARQGLAVASSKGAAKRFKTAEDDFERHVILQQGDAVAGDFYLGSSAGMRNSHARKAGQDDVVSIPVGSHEVDTEADSWLDRSLADLNKDDLKAVSLADITLLQKEEEDKKKVWVLDGATKEETEQEAVDKLLNKVTAISVQSVLDPATLAALFKEDPAVQFTVTKQDDSKLTYTFVREEDYFILKMSDNELYFKVGKWLVEDLTEAKREKLLVGYEEEKEEQPAIQEAPLPLPDTAEQAAVPAPEQEEEQEILPEFLTEEDDENAVAVQDEVGAPPVSEKDEEAVASAEPDARAETAEQSDDPADSTQGVEQDTVESEQQQVEQEAEAVQAAQPETPAQEAAIPKKETYTDSVVQETQAVEQNAAQEEAVREENPEQEQVQEGVQQNPANDSEVESSGEQKQEVLPEKEAAE